MIKLKYREITHDDLDNLPLVCFTNSGELRKVISESNGVFKVDCSSPDDLYSCWTEYDIGDLIGTYKILVEDKEEPPSNHIDLATLEEKMLFLFRYRTEDPQFLYACMKAYELGMYGLLDELLRSKEAK